MKNFYILTLLFFTYSFLGWIIEVIAYYCERKKIVNRGFLIGPIIPIFGVGSIIISLFLSKYQKDPVALFILSLFTCSTLEYLTSYIMEKLFKNRWWDYSHKKFNINGRVCLEIGLLFGLGGILLVYGINPLFLHLYQSLNKNLLKILTYFLLTIFIIDCSISFNIIINLKKISNNIKSDSTEIITKKVFERVSQMSLPYRRLLQSFPEMKVFNRMSILKEKIIKTKEELKKEKRR